MVVLGAVWCLDFCGSYQWEVEQVGGGGSTAMTWCWAIFCWLLREGAIRLEQAMDESSPVSLVRCLIDPVLEQVTAINGGSGDSSK
jgi:hypothetical protein